MYLFPKKCKLFDCLVASVLNYGCEIWGNNHRKYIETVHTKFCRYVLGVKNINQSLFNVW